MSNFFQRYFKRSKEKKITIIHCGDHALFRYGVRTALKDRNDIEIVGECGNGLELLNLRKTRIPDIIILNVNIPVMNGIETLPKIKEKYPNLKVIVLSMHYSTEMIVKMMRLGSNKYLTKNISSEEIYRAIKCVHEFNYCYSESIERAFLGSDIKV